MKLKLVIAFLIGIGSLITAFAEDLVVLECNTDQGRLMATLEINLSEKTIQYDDVLSRLSNDQWNVYLKSQATKEGKEFKPSRYQPRVLPISGETPSELQAKLTVGDLIINRFTLTLKIPAGEFKCERKKKQF